MSLFTIDTPVLKVEGLETKFDLATVSNSLVNLLESYLEARIFQQFHYWCHSGYGVVIDGVRWIYKPIRELVSEVLIGFTNWQIRKAIASLIEKGLIKREHLYDVHHGHNYAPKNRTYYYSLNYEKLAELVKERQKAESVENNNFVSDTKQPGESFEKSFGEQPQNKSENTSTKHNQRERPLPNPSRQRSPKPILKSQMHRGGGNSPNTSSNSKPINHEKGTHTEVKLSQVIARPEKPNVGHKAVEVETNPGAVEEKINKNVSTSKPPVQEPVPKPDREPEVQETVQSAVVQETVQVESESEPLPKRQKTPKGTKPRKRTHEYALWETVEERNRFEQELTARVVSGVGNARNPMALVRYVLNQITQGHSHPYWEEWKAGILIGTCETQEWEASPGHPYPKFVEYLVENLEYEKESRSQAFFRLGKILNDRSQARLHWRNFKRILEGMRQDAEKAAANGQQVALPVWFIDRAEISLERAGESAQTLTKLAPEQTDWVYRGLPESEKLLTAAANSLQPGIPELPPGLPESKPSEITVSPDPWADDDDNDDDDFCFNGFIDLGYLEQQAKKVAANPGKLSLLLMDFKSAVAQATQKQREKIRRMLTPIYPDLLDFL